jgi:hypothetical protein
VANLIKPFTDISYDFSKYAGAFFLTKRLQLSQMFADKARSFPRVEHLKIASLGQDLALPTNIKLGWKGLAWTNALAYFEKS